MVDEDNGRYRSREEGMNNGESDDPLGYAHEQLTVAQAHDQNFGPLLKYFNEKVLPKEGKRVTDILNQLGDYAVMEGVLYHFDYLPGKGKKKDSCRTSLCS